MAKKGQGRHSPEPEREGGQLSRLRNDAAKRFLFADADLALVFCETAKQTQDRARAAANLKNAEKAFNFIAKARSRLVFSADENSRLDDLLTRLHEALTECIASGLVKSWNRA